MKNEKISKMMTEKTEEKEAMLDLQDRYEVKSFDRRKDFSQFKHGLWTKRHGMIIGRDELKNNFAKQRHKERLEVLKIKN